MTRQEIETAIADLETAKRARLTGKARQQVSYDGGGVTFVPATIAEIEQEIVKLRLQLAKLTGAPSGLGPIRIGFGGRM
ncbi:hypothetical protein [Stappia albiluteola]|nr:hypothetical protein [Stappia albiluteola]